MKITADFAFLCMIFQSFQELKEFVANYKPLEEMKIPEVNILLIGQVGAGKSSFLNTINSIFKGGYPPAHAQEAPKTASLKVWVEDCGIIKITF